MGSPAESSRCVCFGEFTLDPRTGEVRVSGQSFYLQDKPLQVLVLLLEHPGQLVTREELKKWLWSADTFVDFDQSLNKAVNRLREALKDSSEHPRFIKTLPRRGYRFLAPVTIEHHREAVSAEPRAPALAVAQPARTTSSTASVAATRRHKWSIRVTNSIALLLVTAAAYGIHAFVSRTRPVPYQNFSVNKITETGKARLVAISPDGKYILSVVDDQGQQSLWLRNIPTNSNTQVMPPEPLQYQALRFSPDGNYLYFVRGESGQGFRYLYRAPVLGGTPQKLISDVDSNISFSPDGRSLAYSVGNNPETGKFRLVTYLLETGKEKTLVTGNLDQFLTDPAWSPDGKTIACVIFGIGALSGMVNVDAITGKQTPLFESTDGSLSGPVWVPDGRDLLALYYGRDTNFTRHEIVEISYPHGTVRAVTHDLNDYSGLSLSADGHTLATVLNHRQFSLFVAPSSALGSGQAQQLTFDARVYSFTWTPDGQMILDQQEPLNLFNPDTGKRTPLSSTLPAGSAWYPSSCANGRYVAFTLAGHGSGKTTTVWRMDTGGGNLTQLSEGKDDEETVCSPDGKWVFYWDIFNGFKLTRVPLGGGKSERLSELPIASRGFDISPDGMLAAFATFLSPGNFKKQMALVPVDSPQNTKLFDLQRQVPYGGAVRFTHDGKAVVYPFRDQDVDNLWLQPLDGTPGKQITNFKSEQIADFHWSFDGSKLGMVRGHSDSDVVLLQESKP